MNGLVKYIQYTSTEKFKITFEFELPNLLESKKLIYNFDCSKELECGLQMEVDDAGDSTTDSQAEDDESLCYW